MNPAADIPEIDSLSKEAFAKEVGLPPPPKPPQR